MKILLLGAHRLLKWPVWTANVYAQQIICNLVWNQSLAYGDLFNKVPY